MTTPNNTIMKINDTDEALDRAHELEAENLRLRGALQRALTFFSAGLNSAGFDPTDREAREAANSIQLRLEDMRSALSSTARPRRSNIASQTRAGEANST